MQRSIILVNCSIIISKNNKTIVIYGMLAIWSLALWQDRNTILRITGPRKNYHALKRKMNHWPKENEWRWILSFCQKIYQTSFYTKIITVHACKLSCVVNSLHAADVSKCTFYICMQFLTWKIFHFQSKE